MPYDIESIALIVVDLQMGFDDPGWGRRNNPSCESNIASLIDRWRAESGPIVFVRHDSALPDSPLRPGQSGNDFRPEVRGEPDLMVAKTVNSAFLGDPDLDDWLTNEGIKSVAITGVQTNYCCETTARMAGNLGYDTLFVLDATHTFDLPAYGGGTISADELARVTASNLDGEFAEIVNTADLLE